MHLTATPSFLRRQCRSSTSDTRFEQSHTSNIFQSVTCSLRSSLAISQRDSPAILYGAFWASCRSLQGCSKIWGGLVLVPFVGADPKHWNVAARVNCICATLILQRILLGNIRPHTQKRVAHAHAVPGAKGTPIACHSAMYSRLVFMRVFLGTADLRAQPPDLLMRPAGDFVARQRSVLGGVPFLGQIWAFDRQR